MQIVTENFLSLGVDKDFMINDSQLTLLDIENIQGWREK